MNYKLEDLVDIPILQNLQEKLYAIYSFPSAIIDNSGKILTAVSWQDVCTKFHRKNPTCEKECIKSDQYIIDHIHEANPSIAYRCPHGLVDNAIPIIIEEKHMGNFFMGQFFLEKPDLEFFRKQSKIYGFDENEYLEAVSRVPVWSTTKVSQYLDFIKGFIEIVAGIGLRNLKEIEISEALRKSEERYKSILQSTFDWIWEVDDQGRYVYCSEKIEQILGYKVEEIIGKTPFDLMHLNEAEKTRSVFMNIIDSQRPIVDLENWNIHKNGTNVCLLTNGVPIFNTSGKLTGYRGADKDITAHKTAERALRDSEEYSSQLFDASPDGLVIIGNDGCIVRANTAQVKMYGYDSPIEMIGLDATKLIIPSARGYLVEILKRHLKGEVIPAVESELVRKNGSTFYGETLAANLKDSDGVLSGYIWITRDVSERKNTELELIKAKERAEESDRLKSAFLANMSHEIRTPMNGILGFTGLLKEPKLSGEEQSEYISIIEKSGVRMLNIINDIISISKVESGQMEVSLDKTNINLQMDYIFRFYKPEAEQKGISLVCKNSIPDSEAIINTDKEKVYAILTNLIKNALKFTSVGSIEIGLNLKNTPGDNGKQSSFLEFYVKDNGIGIGEEQKEFIFSRFRQGSESLNRSYEGAGLGLSISKAYVEILGGEIWVESKAGMGSVFYFTIPVNSEYTHSEFYESSISAGQEKNQIIPLKILIAEDDEASEKLITRIARVYRGEIINVTTGIGAVECCRDNPDIDLILMDLKMPEMDGYEATRQIRQFNQEVIIIAQTAFALTGDYEKAIEAGCNNAISKPIQKDKLLLMIQKYFKY